MMMRILGCLLALTASSGLSAADYPETAISNGPVRARIALPDARNGYYRGTRFDWSGMITSLEARGHTYFAPFYEKFDPALRDVDFKDTVLAGPNSAASGPVEEFSPLGYTEAKPGGTFIKIGVGALRKPEEPGYDHYKRYEIANPGKWSVKRSSGDVEITQEVRDPESGYGYLYRKIIRLPKGEPAMVLEHSLKNIGEKLIAGNVYDHNFFVIDRQPAGPDVSLKFTFAPRPTRDMGKLAEAHGNQLDYVKALDGGDVAQSPIEGFGSTAADYDFRIENRKTGAGAHVTGDRPLSRVLLWSIRTTVCPEAYIDYHIEPGQEFRWKIRYEFYSLPAAATGANPRP